MLTNVKLGMLLVIRKHIATTLMVLTHVSVVMVGPETGLVAKVSRKLTLLAFKFNDVFSETISTELTTCVIIIYKSTIIPRQCGTQFVYRIMFYQYLLIALLCLKNTT